MRCDCGQWKVDGKCPQCDSAELRRPQWRSKSTEKKVRKQEQTLNRGLGISTNQSRRGFVHFKNERGITEDMFGRVIRRRK